MKEFRDFVSRGNVIDLAVAVVTGAAFTAITTSLVSDIVTPLLGVITFGYDFAALEVQIGTEPGAPILRYGKFIAAVINFLVISVVIFLLVKGINVLSRKKTEEAEPTKPCPYCKQPVPESAVRCYHCTTVLDPAAVPESIR